MIQIWWMSKLDRYSPALYVFLGYLPIHISSLQVENTCLVQVGVGTSKDTIEKTKEGSELGTTSCK